MKKGSKELCLHQTCRLGLAEKLKAALESDGVEGINQQDKLGRTPLHYAVPHEDCVEVLLEKGAGVEAVDGAGDSPLHLAAELGLPMVSYMLATKGQEACLKKNKAGKTPVDLAAATERGEVLNALLLACSGAGGADALSSMKQLLDAGAVCDTWAPNGSSALMLSASIDCTPGVDLLLAHGATVELQDALGRTALMFAAGNDATAALSRLLEAGASVSIRDRRGRSVMDYAVEGSNARRVLQEHLARLESKATELQAALLAELCGEDGPRPAAAQQQQQQQQKAKKGKKKKGGGSKAKKGAAAAVEAPATLCHSLSVVREEVEDEQEQGQGQEQVEEGGLAVAAAAHGSAEGSAAAAQGSSETHADSRPTAASAEGSPQPRPASSEASEGYAPSLPGLDACTGSSGRSSLDGGGGGNSRSPSPPASPGGEWCTVGARAHRSHSKPVPVPLALPQQQQQHQQRGRIGPGQQPHGLGRAGGPRLEVGSLDSSASRLRRCPSNGSLTSSCSDASHDTDLSRLSGSERSVLRTLSRPAQLSAGQQHPAATKGPAAVGAKGGRGLLPASAAWASQHAAPTPAPAAAATGPTSWAKVAEAGAGARPQPAAQPAEGSGHPAPPPAQATAATPAVSPPATALAAAPAAEASASAAAECAAAAAAASKQELAALRDTVARLQREQAEAEQRHRQELACVLEDAAQHEALAVQQAVSAERMNCVVRFTAFLQRSGSTLLTSFPDVFGAGAGAGYGCLSAVVPLRPEEALAPLGADLGSPLAQLAVPPARALQIPGAARQQQQQQLAASAFGASAPCAAATAGGASCGSARSSFDSLLATAANNYLGLAQSPPSALASLPFPHLREGAGASSKFAPAPLGSGYSAIGTPTGAQRGGAVGAASDLFGGSLLGSPLSSSPLASAPFSFQDVEERLRGEYEGNHSAFLVPAAEPVPSPFGASLLSASLHQEL